MAGDYGYAQIYAKCPFYVSDNSKLKRIVCEGITQDCKTVLVFRSGKKRLQHKQIFCDKAYKNCEIYRMLMEKYEDD